MINAKPYTTAKLTPPRNGSLIVSGAKALSAMNPP